MRDVFAYVLTSFIAQKFSALSAVFLFGWAFVFFVLVSLFIIGRLFGFKELNKANFNGNGNEYKGVKGCVNVRYDSLFIFFAVVYKRSQNNKVTMARFCIFERT